jgi:hypothetical protein
VVGESLKFQVKFEWNNLGEVQLGVIGMKMNLKFDWLPWVLVVWISAKAVEN